NAVAPMTYATFAVGGINLRKRSQPHTPAAAAATPRPTSRKSDTRNPFGSSKPHTAMKAANTARIPAAPAASSPYATFNDPGTVDAITNQIVQSGGRESTRSSPT